MCSEFRRHRALFLSLLLMSPASAQARDVTPRTPLPKTPVRDQLSTQAARQVQRPEDVRVLVKFADDVEVRLDGANDLHSLAGADLSAAMVLVQAHAGLLKPGLDIGPARLEALLERAEARSGRAQPDLLGMIEIALPTGASLDERIELAESIQSLPVVEFACLMPPMLAASDIPPFTPWMQFLQTYRHPDPGVDVDFAWSLGLRGAGIRFSDVEYAWNTAHEDLVDKTIHAEPGQTPTAMAIADWQDHGTAVLGELVAVVNGYGCTGLVPEVEVWTYPSLTVESGSREEDAAAAAIADSAPGDVVLLELQWSSGGGTPAEVNQAMWLIVSVAKDAGVVVVEAAGNGNANLDGLAYQTYMSWGDSGAIIVGAGSSDTLHSKLSFSTFGSRVDVQAWGENVFTLGYGTFAQYGGDPNQKYAYGFSGTSSASGIVAATAALLEEYANETLLAPLAPLVLRSLLKETGIAQDPADTKPIGPHPNLAAAIAAMPTPWTDLGYGLAGSSGIPEIVAKGTLAPVTPVQIGVQLAPPGSACWLIAGSVTAPTPFKGGTLVPQPDIALGPFAADAAGGLLLSSTWPTGIVPGTTLTLQWWVKDSGGPQGFAASDGVLGTLP